MAQNVQNLGRLEVKKGGSLIGCGALTGEFTVLLITNFAHISNTWQYDMIIPV